MLPAPSEIGLTFAELLTSKLCHDLISPVGAINNGIELLKELGPDALDDTQDLISQSAAQATRKLRCFRIAYGMSGNELDLKDVREAALGFFEDSKIILEWPEDQIHNYKDGLGKVVLNTALLARETLGISGTITVNVNDNDAVITTSGKTVALLPPIEEALKNNTIIDADSKTIQCAAAQFFAQRLGVTVNYTQHEETHIFRLEWL